MRDLPREALLALARDAVRATANGQPREAPETVLGGPAATFVTLRSADGALRGCIGELVARRPLHEAIWWSAGGAASRDPRFRPVTPEEVDGLRIEVTVLGPLSTLPLEARPEGVEVGRHGLLVSGRGRRGVLLPVVASERGWDAATFLAAMCRKAGLPLDAWKAAATRVEVFEALELHP